MNDYQKEPEKRVELSPGGYTRERRGKSTGAWSYLLRHYSVVAADYGSIPSKSEYRMELMGAVKGLQRLKYPCQVELRTGCEYLSDGVRRLQRGRKSDSFVGAVFMGTAKNSDLWKEIESLIKIHRVKVIWVPFRSKDMDSREARSYARKASYSLPSSTVRAASEQATAHPKPYDPVTAGKSEDWAGLAADFAELNRNDDSSGIAQDNSDEF